ncbi:MAG: hypothetical protein HY815_00125 [Candidatus Riflebacteria bacterium]|nr:hypothetical protein [Candidatus Riflebacteria bacterium]
MNKSKRKARSGPDDPSAADEKLVHTWWEEFKPFYRTRDTEEMLRRIYCFLQEHPRQFIHLRLDEECLFELGGSLQRKGEHARYVELLLRIRKEQPEAYLLSQGYFDLEIIAELLATGRRSEVPTYFDLFKKHPTDFVDELASLVDILLATNSPLELFDLTRVVAGPVHDSPDVIQGDFALDWVVFEQFVPALDRREVSKKAVQQVMDRLEPLDVPFELNTASIATDLEETLGGFPDLRSVIRKGKAAHSRWCQKLLHHFTGFVHDAIGVSWASSRYFASHIANYLFTTAADGGVQHALTIKEASLDRYIAAHCRKSMVLDGVAALSLLQGVWWLSGYLEHHGFHDGKARARIEEDCLRLFRPVKRALHPTDDGLRLLGDFPKYRWTS